MADEKQYKSVDKVDRVFGELSGLPDVLKTSPSTKTTHSPLVGATQQFIIQTLRQREVGDWLFITYVDAEGSVRIAVPPQATAAIYAQRDALTAKSRKLAARERAKRDKAAGVVPGFMRGRKLATKKKAPKKEGDRGPRPRAVQVAAAPADAEAAQEDGHVPPAP